MADLVDMFEPVPDFAAPTMEQTRRMVSFIDEQTAAGKPVAVSCYAGVGRTGTVLACYLVHRGAAPEDAVRRVRELRPGSIQTRGQEEAVHQYAEEEDPREHGESNN